MTDGTLLVEAAIAPLLAEPRAGAEQVSQRLAGHELDVLEVRSPWFRARGADAYEGWIHSGYVRVTTIREARRRYASRRVSLGCIVREADGRVRALPLGALVADDAAIEQGEALDEQQMRERFLPSAADAAQSALTLFQGAPYQWGGVTPWGVDCSGLVQSVFGLHGIAVPRDARQQAELGEPLSVAPTRLRAGDLLFFSSTDNGDITHVGIALGDERLVHAAIGRGGWAVERMDSTEDPYVASLRARATSARRLSSAS
jgi:hypothetical protein